MTGSSPDAAATKNTAYMSPGRLSFPPLSRTRQMRHSVDWTNVCAERRCWSLFAFQKFH